MTENQTALFELRFLLAEQYAQETVESVIARWSLLDKWLIENAAIAKDNDTMRDFLRNHGRLYLSAFLWMSTKDEMKEHISHLSFNHQRGDYKDNSIATSPFVLDRVVLALKNHKGNERAQAYLLPKVFDGFFRPVKLAQGETDVSVLFDVTSKEQEFIDLILTDFEKDLSAFLKQFTINQRSHAQEDRIPQITKILLEIEKRKPQSPLHHTVSVLYLASIQSSITGSSRLSDIQMFAKSLQSSLPKIYLDPPAETYHSRPRLHWEESFLSWASYVAKGVFQNPYLSSDAKKCLIPDISIFQKAAKNNDLDVTHATKNSLGISRYPFDLDPEGADKAVYAATMLQKNFLDILTSRTQGIQKSAPGLLASIKKNDTLYHCFKIDNLKGVLWSKYQGNLIALLKEEHAQKWAELKKGLLEKDIQDVIEDLPKRLRATITWIFSVAYPDVPLPAHHKTDVIFSLQAPASAKYGRFKEIEQLFDAEKTKSAIHKKLDKSKKIVAEEKEELSDKRVRRM